MTTTTRALTVDDAAHALPVPGQIPATTGEAAGAGLTLSWSWCARCRRAYPTGTYRIVRFGATRHLRFPKELHLCPYQDCSGSLTRDRWLWSSVRVQHPEYPAEPAADVRYGDA